MNESLLVDGDADVQFLVREVHENEIAGAHLAARDRHSHAHLFRRRTRDTNSGAVRRVRDQSAAVESARRSAAESIRLAEHGQGAIDHYAARIPWGARRRIRRLEPKRCGLGLWRMAGLERRARACGQRDDERGGENCPDTAHRSGPIR